MKINTTTHSDAIKAYSSSSTPKIHQANEVDTEGKFGPASLRDKVEISEKVKLYQDIRNTALSSPDIRTDKVEDLKDKISTGIYRADMTVIADKLLSPDISSRI